MHTTFTIGYEPAWACDAARIVGPKAGRIFVCSETGDGDAETILVCNTTSEFVDCEISTDKIARRMKALAGLNPSDTTLRLVVAGPVEVALRGSVPLATRGFFSLLVWALSLESSASIADWKPAASLDFIEINSLVATETEAEAAGVPHPSAARASLRVDECRLKRGLFICAKYACAVGESVDTHAIAGGIYRPPFGPLSRADGDPCPLPPAHTRTILAAPLERILHRMPDPFSLAFDTPNILMTYPGSDLHNDLGTVIRHPLAGGERKVVDTAKRIVDAILRVLREDEGVEVDMEAVCAAPGSPIDHRRDWTCSVCLNGFDAGDPRAVMPFECGMHRVCAACWRSGSGEKVDFGAAKGPGYRSMLLCPQCRRKRVRPSSPAQMDV